MMDERVRLFRPLPFAAFGRWCSTSGGMISTGMFDHLLADLSLKFLCLTADLIELVEDRLQFIRRQRGHEPILCKLRYCALIVPAFGSSVRHPPALQISEIQWSQVSRKSSR